MWVSYMQSCRWVPSHCVVLWFQTAIGIQPMKWIHRIYGSATHLHQFPFLARNGLQWYTVEFMEAWTLPFAVSNSHLAVSHPLRKLSVTFVILALSPHHVMSIRAYVSSILVWVPWVLWILPARPRWSLSWPSCPLGCSRSLSPSLFLFSLASISWMASVLAWWISIQERIVPQRVSDFLLLTPILASRLSW